MTTRILALVVAVACSFGGTAASAINHKSLDPVALRDTVEATAKELMLPGTMVLLLFSSLTRAIVGAYGSLWGDYGEKIPTADALSK